MNKKISITVFAILGLILVVYLAFLGFDKSEDVAKGDVPAQKEEKKMTLEEAKPFNDGVYFNNVSYDELQELLPKEEDVNIFFYKPTCLYCEIASPKVAEAAKETGVKVVSINLREYPEAAKTYNVSRVSTLTVFHAGSRSTHRYYSFKKS